MIPAAFECYRLRIHVYGRHGEMVGVTSNDPDQINQLVAKAKSVGH